MNDSKEIKSTSKRRSPGKILAYVVITLVVLFLVAECGLRLFGAAVKPAIDEKGSEVPDCEAISFLAIGDSMTFGLGAERDEAYVVQMLPFFEKAYPDIPVKVYNIGMPGTNTSEGIGRIRKFFSSNRAAKPNFAFVLYGVNNRWNLHKATFWEWEGEAKRNHLATYITSHFQIGKAIGVASESGKETVDKLRSYNKYRDMLGKKGWSLFFEGFNDDLLMRWIIHDTRKIVNMLRKREIEPIFLTYFTPKFPFLNNLLRKMAKNLDAPLLDLEKPGKYYDLRGLFAEDRFHLTGKGYGDVAKRLMIKFQDLYDYDAILERLERKRQSAFCSKHQKKSKN